MAPITRSLVDSISHAWEVDVDVFLSFHGNRSEAVESAAVSELSPVSVEWYPQADAEVAYSRACDHIWTPFDGQKGLPPGATARAIFGGMARGFQLMLERER